MFRYSYSGLYLSSGVGYQYLTANYPFSMNIDENDFSGYQNFRIPLMLGYYFSRTAKATPILEAGFALCFPIHTCIVNWRGDDPLNPRSMALSFQAGFGFRAMLEQGDAVEFKLCFLRIPNTLDNGPVGSRWIGIGATFTYELKL